MTNGSKALDVSASHGPFWVDELGAFDWREPTSLSIDEINELDRIEVELWPEPGWAGWIDWETLDREAGIDPNESGTSGR